MSDKKVTEYNPATSWTGAEILYLIQGGVDKLITLTNLFAAVPVLAKFTGKFGFGGTHDTIAGDGTIDVTKIIHRLTNVSPSEIAIPAGSFDGQVIVIIAENIVSQASSVVFTGSLGPSLIEFGKTGDSATLMYTQTKWWFIGGSATVA